MRANSPFQRENRSCYLPDIPYLFPPHHSTSLLTIEKTNEIQINDDSWVKGRFYDDLPLLTIKIAFAFLVQLED